MYNDDPAHGLEQELVHPPRDIAWFKIRPHHREVAVEMAVGTYGADAPIHAAAAIAECAKTSRL